MLPPVDLIISEHDSGFSIGYEGKGRYGGKGEFIITAMDAEKMADFILAKKEYNLQQKMEGNRNEVKNA